MTFTPEPRTYNVFYHRDLHPGSDLHWRVAFYGDGHWCRNDGQTHHYPTEAQCEAAGKLWVETGRTNLVKVDTAIDEAIAAKQSRRAA